MRKGIVYCKAIKKKVNKSVFCPDKNCEACPDLHPVKPKSSIKDSKNKYRKELFTPRFKVPFREEVEKFHEEIKRLSKNPSENPWENLWERLSDVKKFIKDTYITNPNVVVAYFSPEQIRNFLIDVGNYGADLVRIVKALKLRYDSFDKVFKPEFPSDINHHIEKWNKERKDFIKKEKAIKGALKLLSNLPPLPTYSLLTSPYPVDLLEKVYRVNKDLYTIKTQLKEGETVIKEYLDLLPYTTNAWWWLGDSIKEGQKKSAREVVTAKRKPITQKSSFWRESIIELVDELKRIGCSDNLAYENTRKLLYYCYPKIFQKYKDLDPYPEIIASRYRYHKKKLPPKK